MALTKLITEDCLTCFRYIIVSTYIKVITNSSSSSTEIQQIWFKKSVIISAIIGATRIVAKNVYRKIGSHTRKTFSRFITEESYTCSNVHNTKSTAICNMKPEQW